MISEACVDDMASHRGATVPPRSGLTKLTYPTTNFNTFHPLDEATNEHINVHDDHRKLVREIDATSIVPLKNVKNALPLKKLRKDVLTGPDAGSACITRPNEVDGVLVVGWGSA
jgi:beta-glucosidase